MLRLSETRSAEVPLAQVLAAMGNPLVFTWAQIASRCAQEGWLEAATTAARTGSGNQSAKWKWRQPTGHVVVRCPDRDNRAWKIGPRAGMGLASYVHVMGDPSRATPAQLEQAARELCEAETARLAALPPSTDRDDRTWATRDWGKYGAWPSEAGEMMAEVRCPVIHRLDVAAWARRRGAEGLARVMWDGGVGASAWMVQAGLERLPGSGPTPLYAEEGAHVATPAVRAAVGRFHQLRGRGLDRVGDAL